MSKSKTKYDLLVPPEFEWPEYNSDSERIKAYSKRFENMSIAYPRHSNWNKGIASIHLLPKRTRNKGRATKDNKIIKGKMTKLMTSMHFT